MSSKIFDGRFSIKLNTKNELVFGKRADGQYDASDADVVYARVKALAKEKGVSFRRFQPEPGKGSPLILADRWGNPYLAILKPNEKVVAKAASRWID